ncbi:MAG: conjugal transfer protein TraF [Candidatus Krumholzibacteriota bacterium]|nr:conjugal transfer protein TraF [Candidatus Krumholzibacteriota bacterium]
MGISRDAGMLWNNPAEAAFIPEGYFTLAEVMATSYRSDIESASDLEENFNALINLKMDAADRMKALRDISDGVDRSPLCYNMSAGALSFVTQSGGFVSTVDHTAVISSSAVDDQREVIMERMMDAKLMFAFTRSQKFLGGKAGWSFGVPIHYLMKINERGLYDEDPSGGGQPVNTGYYNTTTDVGYTVGLDAGFMYEIRNLRVGVAAHNLVSKPIKWKRYRVSDVGDITLFDKDKDNFEELGKEKIEPDYCAGASLTWDINFLGFFRDFQLAGQVNMTKDEEMTFHFGGETRFLRVFRLRSGIDQGGNFCYGAGFSLFRFIECNYSNYYLPSPTLNEDGEGSVQYENVQGISVGIKF